MDLYRESTHPASARSRRRPSRFPGLPGLLLLIAALAALAASPAAGVEIQFATENDFFTPGNRDDLYTFSVALSAQRGPYTFTWREDAFTDRQGGSRFDETRLTVQRAVPGFHAWSLRAEAGIAHVGRGLLGQDTQNALHRLLGDEELDLEYLPSELYPLLGLEAERLYAHGPDLDLGPRIEAESLPGFRSHAVMGAQAHWRARARLAVHLFAGARWSGASLEPLDRHTATLAPVARLGVVFRDRYSVSWTYNDHGVEREHVSFGIRLAGGEWRGGGSGD